MSITELIRRASLEDWMFHHGRNVMNHTKTSIKEYEDAVNELVEALKTAPIFAKLKKRLKQMYLERVYERFPLMWNRDEFNKVITEFSRGDFSHLEDFRKFLIKTAKMYHLDDMKYTYETLREHYIDLKQFNADETSQEITELTTKKRIPNTQPRDEIRRGCYKTIDQLIESCTHMLQNIQNLHTECNIYY